MSIKKTILSILRTLLNGPVQHVTAKVACLAPNELLKGRSALITGGTSGIGYEIAKAFVNSGASVVITGRSEERLNAACKKISHETKCANIFGVVMDNTQVAEMKERFDKGLELLPNHRIDILVNNAGVLGCHISNGMEDEYDQVLDTNLKGVFFLSQLVGHYMKDNGIKGNILNIASSSSLRPAASAYTLSKWGIRGLTLGLAKTLAPYGITVNGLAPGQTLTPMLMKQTGDNLYSPDTPIHRYALPEEIANMAVILVSDMSRMIMGDIIYMTGGAGVFSNEDMNYSFD